MAAPNPIPLDFTAQEIERFWASVEIGNPEQCWPWRGSFPAECDYGAFFARRKRYPAHRVALSLSINDTLDGFLSCHHCDNPPCCNPAHLFKGTPSDNTADRDTKGRTAKGDRHFSRTHPEKLKRGDENGSRKYPERLKRGTENHNAKLTEADVMEIHRMLARGERQVDIAAKFGVAQERISQIKRGEIWRHVIPDVEYDRSPTKKTSNMTKLNPDIVREIRLRSERDGTSYRELAKTYGVSRSNISLIVLRKAWPHVE